MDLLSRLRRVEEAPLLLDGGTGSLLLELGASGSSGRDNLEHAAVVRKVHERYLDAGSEAIVTNSFALTPIYAAKQGFSAVETADSLRRACEIACESAAGRGFVLGDLGPCGQILIPYGEGEPEAVLDSFRQQVRIMQEYPLDGFLIETVFDLREAELMARAVREEAPAAPLLLSLCYSSLKRGGCTMMGDRAANIAAKAMEWGCAAVGGNCGDLSPAEYAQIAATLKANSTLPVLMQPNAGKPRLQGDKVYYDLSPADFTTEMIEQVRPAGASILGGCCGTTPAHIQALAKRLGR